MTTAERAVARALASAFLSGDWSHPALLERGRLATGARPRWLNPLVRDVLELYREPPRDRPRELAAVISAAPAFERAVDRARRQGRTLRVVEIPPAPTRMARTRWPVPAIDDLGALAGRLELDADRLAWFADTSRRQRRAPAGPLHHYRYRWVARPGRLPRLLESPLPRLLAIQRRLLAEVIGLLPPHPAAHGFVPGRSVRTAAGAHVGADVLFCLDLMAFFASVRAGRVYGVLRSAGYLQPVAHVLTGLCTTATPVGVIAAMPPGGHPDERFALRRLLATNDHS